MFFNLVALLPFTLFFPQLAEPQAIPQKPLKGIYLTSQTVVNKKGDILLQNFSKAGGNFIVFDIQNSAGRLAYPSNLPISLELGNRDAQIADLPALVKKLQNQGFYTAARFVLFKNGFLARRKPEWALKRKGTTRPYVSREGPIWLDPLNPEAKEYFIDIARELASAGVDEIQFDYARFPEGGRGGYIGYSFTSDDAFTREQAITNFMAEIAEELHYFNVKASIDVFGIVVWENISKKVIGQDITELAKYVDAIYPMPYPSHFGKGWGGHRNPADEPYFFVQETTKKFVEQTKNTGVKIRPWLQGFALRVSRFGPNYIKEQIRALNDIGIEEFAVWNARNDYWATLKALEN